MFRLNQRVGVVLKTKCLPPLNIATKLPKIIPFQAEAQANAESYKQKLLNGGSKGLLTKWKFHLYHVHAWLQL